MEFNKKVRVDILEDEIRQSSIVTALDYMNYDVENEIVAIYFKASLSVEDESTLISIVNNHEYVDFVEEEFIQRVQLEVKTDDNIPVFSPFKSYKDSSRSFSTPDYANPNTWCHDVTFVTGEVLTTADNITYQSERVVAEGWSHYWIKWERIPNWVRADFPNRKPKVYVNDVVVTDGFVIDSDNGRVTFEEADEARTVTVDYCYGNSADYTLTPIPGKILLVDFVEIQFSNGAKFHEDSPLVFEAIYNGPALPPDSLFPGFPGYPANTDLVVNQFYYYDADDFLNESTGVESGKAFGRLTEDFMVLPWDYLTGHTLKPAGDPTTNIADREFNKLRVRSVKNKPVYNCEIATATFYCKIKNL